jgi:hypothetical protein
MKLILALLILLAVSCRDQPEARSNTKPNGVQVREPVLIVDTVLHPDNSKALNKVFQDCRDSIKRKNQHKKKMTLIWCDSLDTAQIRDTVNINRIRKAFDSVMRSPDSVQRAFHLDPKYMIHAETVERPATVYIDGAPSPGVVSGTSDWDHAFYFDSCFDRCDSAKSFYFGSDSIVLPKKDSNITIFTGPTSVWIDGVRSPGVVSEPASVDAGVLTGIKGFKGAPKMIFNKGGWLNLPHSTIAYRTAFNGAVKKDTCFAVYLVFSPREGTEYHYRTSRQADSVVFEPHLQMDLWMRPDGENKIRIR